MANLPAAMALIDQSRLDQTPDMFRNGFKINIQYACDVFNDDSLFLGNKQKNVDPPMIGNAFKISFELFCVISMGLLSFDLLEQHTTKQITFQHSQECENVVYCIFGLLKVIRSPGPAIRILSPSTKTASESVRATVG